MYVSVCVCLCVCVSGLREITYETGTERVQALADISRSALFCNCNETRVPIANPSQLEGTPTIPQLTSGSLQ